MTTEASPVVAGTGAPAQFTHRQIMVTMSGLVIAMLLAMLDNMIVAPALPSIVGEMIPPRERSKYMGLMMAVMPVAMIGGPLAGGFITDNFSWRWAFYVNLPLGVLALVVCWFTLAKLPRGTGKAKIDWLGA